MQVMTLHDFFDDDVEKVLMDGNYDSREIVLKEQNEGSLIISKEDVIEFAKEFNLVIYEKNSNL